MRLISSDSASKLSLAVWLDALGSGALDGRG
jgi:hypothetical protein